MAQPELSQADRIILSVESGDLRDVQTARQLIKEALPGQNAIPMMRVGEGVLANYSLDYLCGRNLSSQSGVVPFVDTNYMSLRKVHFPHGDFYYDPTMLQITSILGAAYMTVNADCDGETMRAMIASRGYTELVARPVPESYAERRIGNEYVEEKVLRLGAFAARHGVAGIITSGYEMRALRQDPDTGDILRFAGNLCLLDSEASAANRKMTPAQAREEGADFVVVEMADLFDRKTRHPADMRPDYERAKDHLAYIAETLP